MQISKYPTFLREAQGAQ